MFSYFRKTLQLRVPGEVNTSESLIRRGGVIGREERGNRKGFYRFHAIWLRAKCGEMRRTSVGELVGLSGRKSFERIGQ